MNTKNIINKTFIDSGKAVYENGFNTLAAINDTAEKAVDSALEHAPWVTKEVKEAVNTWFEASKAGRNNVKTIIDENFKTIEGLLA